MNVTLGKAQGLIFFVLWNWWLPLKMQIIIVNHYVEENNKKKKRKRKWKKWWNPNQKSVGKKQTNNLNLLESHFVSVTSIESLSHLLLNIWRYLSACNIAVDSRFSCLIAPKVSAQQETLWPHFSIICSWCIAFSILSIDSLSTQNDVKSWCYQKILMCK